MIGPGFIFWGLFAVFGVIVAAYLIWMRRTDRRDGSTASDSARNDDLED